MSASAADPGGASRQGLPSARLAFAGGVLGFSLGGFFDGILLHQVLQWHHLFSLVPGAIWRDMRMQILMGGLFHVAHFVIAVVGLSLLWRARRDFSGTGADRRLIGAALLGFSCWQFVDVVLFHWIFVIHRIRVDVPNPLVYDLGWLLLFGVSSLLAGLWLRGQSGRGTGSMTAAGLAALVLVSAPWAAQSPPGSRTMVVFGSGMTATQTYAAAASVDRSIIWADPSGGVVMLDRVSTRDAWQLYRRGAVMVGSGIFAGSCLTWAQS